VEERLITISVGIVSLWDHRPDDPDEFITMAERALFLAKAEGRDRVVAYRPLAENPPNASHQSIIFLKETLAKIFEKTRTSAISSLQLLAKDIAGEKNKHHIKNVKTYVELLGQHMNLADPIIQTFKNAFTLHSSIRFLLHNEMINKVERFSPGDREIMNDFPYKINEITKLFDYFSNERDVLLHHGERYDGSGYPEGLKGTEIPLGARIFGIVDALAAMGADRPHRKRLEPAEIIEELTNEAGKQFDPYLVIKILETIKVHQLLEIEADIIDAAIDKTRNSYPDCSL
jgi:HD-GYP domain-containing protein (c-di-GMP phosphodiesterase class II)